ncbi:MAG: M16 family metallopeptidase [Ilumatobacteraceae bacterium]
MRRISGVAALVVAGLLAACTSSSDVSSRRSDNAGSVPLDSTTTTPTIAPAPTSTSPDDGGDTTTVVAPTGADLPSISEPDPAIVMGTLDNGLRYLIRENDNPGGNAEMRLVVDAGSALQDAEQDGGAHFLEHMLFNGTEEFPENELIAVLRSFGAAFGADINAYTSYDETVYELSVPTADPTNVETGLDVLSQWLTAALIDPVEVEAERGVVLDEWRIREQSADGRIFDVVEEMFLAGSPYDGQDPIGTAAAIETTVADPLRGFYDDWYRPDNVAIVVVGDIDASTIEEGIVERFGPATSRGTAPERPELVVIPAAEPQARVLGEPDVAEGFAFVNLPLAVDVGVAPEDEFQRAVLDAIAFDIVATRLSNAALRGATPYDDASVDSSSIVRGLDAPEILVDADGADMQASVQAVLDEYERVRRFGFTADEVDRAVAAQRSEAQTLFEARESRQDRSFADEYVRHVLEGEPTPTAEDQFELTTAVLDAATPETVAYGLVQRLAASGPHILVVVPEREIGDVPEAMVFEQMAATVGDRELEPPEAEAEVLARLMEPPEPVEEVSADLLSDGGTVSFVAPLVLTFDNGVRVSLNQTEIVEGSLAFSARSVGGLDAVDDTSVPDAAAPVVDNSGLGPHDVVTVEAFLADKDVGLESFIDQFVEGFSGSTAAADLEVLFQLVHLAMTEPSPDERALEQYLDDSLPLARDPSLDPGTAEFDALLDARYDDPRFLLPTEESLAEVDIEGIERVYRDRFGDAGDWAFALSGDFDFDTAVDLSRRYLGTLPATGRVEETDFVEPPPPDGIVVEQVNAGEGDTARVSFLFTAPASADRLDDVTAALVDEVVSARLTDTIREELGESYSPFAVSQLTDGGTPNAEFYISVSADPDQLEAVSAAVLNQLDALRADGPTDVELNAAQETVRRSLDLFTNEEINDEVLSVLTDPAGNADFQDYLESVFLVDAVTSSLVQDRIATWLPADQFIEVRVLPR